ncbi:aryl-sulfate sulfotransferase [Lachnoclostridium phytofermentans]|uniref:Arylsulfotransferase N-terminal domain-containing protein n=1 Tax=Lachnoclostridium phytofermentans (strain ATCC 700394 / DSM 18823 / ISDg) TaxID=357809 RepID=A9KSI7_LACP7|nr:aryl-sulfate sulfotransferase [Lachnoclostridium phytofermentans]ABX43639.1 hypothetical protein Cphy_3285 [Lachnoclostridium phytofermentans ISDg]
MFHFRGAIRLNYYNRCMLVLLVATFALLSFGCNRRYAEGSDSGKNIWGFGNNENSPYENTYKENKVTNAAENSYTFYSAKDFETLIFDSSNVRGDDIYSLAYQEGALNQLLTIKKSKAFTIENPLFIQNPFGTNSNGLYVYVGTPSQKVRISYKISVSTESIPDFGDSLYFNRTEGTEVEGQIIGLIEGQRNKVILIATDLNGKLISQMAYFFDIASTHEMETKLNTQYGEQPTFTRGLFSFFHKDGVNSSFLFYDNHGVLRANIPTKYQSEDAKVLQIKNEIFYAIKENEYILLDNLGNVIKRYTWEGHGKLFDCDYDDKNNKVIFLANTENDSMINRGVELNIAKGGWKEIINFAYLLPHRKSETNKEEGIEKDWLDLSSIQLINGKDILVCSKELSTVFRINNLYTGPVIRWLMSGDKNWNNKEYQSMLLTELGETTTKTSIDSMDYETNRRLSEGQFYLSCINYDTTDVANDTKYSVFYKYLIEDSQNRYRLIQKIDFPYHSGHCSSILYGNHIILSFDAEKQFIEYDEKGNAIATYQTGNKKAFYKVYKYTMDRYWF